MKYLTILFLILLLSFPVFSESKLAKKGKVFIAKLLSIEEDKTGKKDSFLLPQSYWDYSKKNRTGAMEEDLEDLENNEEEHENEELEEDL
jgi:hypothetical protein